MSSVAVFAPRRAASSMRSLVSSGHLICTKCTSAAEAMPASFIAAATALAVSSICAWRPISSGLKARVRPTPMASRGAVAAAGTSSRQNTSRCGDKPALGAAGHHHGDALLDLRWRAFQALGQQQLQRQRRVAARKVVHAAIALGLADDRHDRRGIDLAPVDGGGERRGVARACRRQPQHAGAAGHLRPPCRRRCRGARGDGAR